MTRPTARRTIRRTTGALAALALGLVLGACGGSDDEPASEVSEADLTSALLTTDDLPDGFVETEESADGGADQVGCLQATGALDDLETDTEARRSFELQNESGVSGVLSKLNSSADPTVLRDTIETYRDEVAGCTEIDETDPQGVVIDLTITVDDETSSDAADEQVNFNATGTIGQAQTSYPYSASFNVTLAGNTLAIVAAYEIAVTDSGVVDGLPDLNAIVLDRLVGDAG